MLIGAIALGSATRDAQADTTLTADEQYPLECVLIASGGADHSNDPADYTLSAVLDNGSGFVIGDSYHPAYEGTSRGVPREAALAC